MKHFFKKYYTDLFPGKRFFAGTGLCVSLFLFAFFLPWLGDLPYLCFWALVCLTLIDLVLLYRTNRGIFIRRDLPERLSNGDDNEIRIYIENFYPFSIQTGIIDEIPFQFQKRDIWFESRLKPAEHKTINYVLRPVKRGEYLFGSIRVYVQSPLGLICRRFNSGTEVTVPVYPSFL
ncbi:MAG TPA: DUF58 domain-containing protein, partial [Pedobacter sp.]